MSSLMGMSSGEVLGGGFKRGFHGEVSGGGFRGWFCEGLGFSFRGTCRECFRAHGI